MLQSNSVINYAILSKSKLYCTILEQYCQVEWSRPLDQSHSTAELRGKLARDNDVENNHQMKCSLMIHKSIPVLCNPRKFADHSAVPGISFHKHSWSIRHSCRTTETLAAPFIKTTGGLIPVLIPTCRILKDLEMNSLAELQALGTWKNLLKQP